MPSTWEIVVVVVAIAVAFIAVRLSVSFDVNKWLKSRRERDEERLRLLCPHSRIVRIDDEYAVESYFYPLPGIMGVLGCSQCGQQIANPHIAQELSKQWVSNVKGLEGQQKEFDELRRKVYKLKK